MKDYTQRRLEKFDEKFGKLGLMADGITSEGEVYGSNHVKDFLATSIQQAIAEERERVRGEIENECNSELVYAGKTLADSGEMGFLNVLILRLKGNILSSLQDNK